MPQKLSWKNTISDELLEKKSIFEDNTIGNSINCPYP